jgi:hypothetical protein
MGRPQGGGSTQDISAWALPGLATTDDGGSERPKGVVVMEDGGEDPTELIAATVNV